MSEEKKVFEKRDGGDPRKILLRVLGDDDSIMKFTVMRDSSLQKLMFAYCEHTGKSMNLIRFVYESDCITEMDTPNSLQMKEGDVIETYPVTDGGVSFLC